MAHKPLTTRDIIALHNIQQAAAKGEMVAWRPKEADLQYGDIQYGTARALVGDPETFGFIPAGMDIRDAYLWVISRGPVEYAWPVAELMEAHWDGAFARNYRPMNER